jgi:hypothetical protein
MPDWIALCDRDGPIAEGMSNGVLAKGQFVLEFELPLMPATVLLDLERNTQWARRFSIFADEAAGLVILHRQGQHLVKHVLPGPLDLPLSGAARLVLGWDGPARDWTLQLDLPGTGQQWQSAGKDPIPMLLDDVLQLCSQNSPARRDSSVLWFGAKQGRDLPQRAPWIGINTPVQTVNGLRWARDLSPGDEVVSEDGAVLPIRSLKRMDLPGRGSFSPILLRAPFFAAGHDLLVSADHLLALSGPTVEYLCGEETVLAEAQHLTDGKAAMKDLRRSVTSCICLDLGQPALFYADGCALLSQGVRDPASQRLGKWRVLAAYEAIPLLALLARNPGRNAA